MTLKDIFEQMMELKAPLISYQTYITNIGFFSNHIDPFFGNRDIGTIQYIDYQKFTNFLLLEKSLKPKTVKNIFVVISSIYKFAKINNWYQGDSPLKYVELPKFDNRRYFTLNVDYQRRYIKAILDFDEPIYRDIFLFLLHGRRLNEVLSLKWEFLDLENGIMYLPAKKNKSRKNLSFELTKPLLDSLECYMYKAFREQNTPFISGYVFKNPKTNTRFKDVRKPWKRLLKKAGLPYIRIHDIRHLVATYSINVLELPVEKVSHMLGHSDIKITQRYINPNPKNAKEVVEVLINSVLG